jgi:hypothetical protein
LRLKRPSPTPPVQKQASDPATSSKRRADHPEKLTTKQRGPDRHSGIVQQQIAFEASLEAIPFPLAFIVFNFDDDNFALPLIKMSETMFNFGAHPHIYTNFAFRELCDKAIICVKPFTGLFDSELA